MSIKRDILYVCIYKEIFHSQKSVKKIYITERGVYIGVFCEIGLNYQNLINITGNHT